MPLSASNHNRHKVMSRRHIQTHTHKHTYCMTIQALAHALTDTLRHSQQSEPAALFTPSNLCATDCARKALIFSSLPLLHFPSHSSTMLPCQPLSHPSAALSHSSPPPLVFFFSSCLFSLSVLSSLKSYYEWPCWAFRDDFCSLPTVSVSFYILHLCLPIFCLPSLLSQLSPLFQPSRHIFVISAITTIYIFE